MAIASYMQARSEGVKNPKTAAVFTFVAYIAVALLLSIPYLTLPSLTTAFAVMLIIATTTTAYMTLYTSVINDRKFTREFIEAATLIFGVSTLLYIVGIFVREFLGVTVG
jgi:VIT1/CCC1 family predicted Fe2+/Mn2+ transporter